MARKTKAEAEKTRQCILKAALRLFVEKGYDRTTFEDVARHIGLTKGAVYWHFKSKPDLLAELVVLMTARHTTQLPHTIPHTASLDTPEALTENFVLRARLIVSSPASRRFFLMTRRLDWASPKLTPVRQRIRRLADTPHVVICSALKDMQRTGAIRADADLAAVSSVLMMIWLGLLEQEISNGLGTDLDGALRFGFLAILNGVKHCF